MQLFTMRYMQDLKCLPQLVLCRAVKIPDGSILIERGRNFPVFCNIEQANNYALN